ncbi:hypothetical protein [Mycoplasma capricolum]|uniref:hypothetical protein n=1 Tax=Mycoplasma capricolum TaxID=2095 RepID=UPI003DA65307
MFFMSAIVIHGISPFQNILFPLGGVFPKLKFNTFLNLTHTQLSGISNGICIFSIFPFSNFS